MVAQKMVNVKAEKRGTVTLASGIYHVDPDGVPAARGRAVPMDAALELKRKGYASILKTKVVPDDGDEDETMGSVSARRVGNQPRDAAPPILGLGGESTRDTTHGSGEALAGGLDGSGDDTDIDDDGLDNGTGAGDEDAVKPNARKRAPRVRNRNRSRKAAAPDAAAADAPPAE